MTSQKDYVLHMAETPDPVEDEVSDVEQEIPPTKKSTAKPSTLGEMNNQWLATHAKQVKRLLFCNLPNPFVMNRMPHGQFLNSV